MSPLDAIAGARHADPFSVLGPHIDDGLLTIRAYLPAAKSISVVRDGAEPLEMTRRHAAGVFEASVDGVTAIPDYRLRVSYPGGHTVDVDDPYRYGRIIDDYDLYLFGEGSHTRIYDKLGAHPMTVGTAAGVHFAVWAPNALRASVVGDFNSWDGRVHPMRLLGSSGVWEIFVPAAKLGDRYKFEMRTRTGGIVIKTDPFGLGFEVTAEVGVHRDDRGVRVAGRRAGCAGVRRPARGSSARCLYTRCTSDRGRELRRTATGISRIASSRCG